MPNSAELIFHLTAIIIGPISTIPAFLRGFQVVGARLSGGLISLLLLASISTVAGCDLIKADDPEDLDFRGEWLLIAQHQNEAELTIRYLITLTENRDHMFAATAQQFLLEMPIGAAARDVTGQILFGENVLRLEIDFPNTGLGPEIVEVRFLRVRTKSSLVAMEGIRYRGKSVGLLMPGGAVIPYDTNIMTMEQITPSS